MTAICSLKPNVTREQAVKAFMPRGPVGLLRQLVLGRLRSVAQVYLPLRLYKVEIVNRGRAESRIFGLDAISGSLDLYGFDCLPGPAETVRVETRNYPAPALDEALGRNVVVNKVRHLLFLGGFFRIRDLRISAEQLPLDLHVPYWVGFYGAGERVRFAVMDAVRRRREGAKVREVLHRWLTFAQ